MPNAGTIDFTARIDYRAAETSVRRFQQQIDRGFGKNNGLNRAATDAKSFERTLGQATNRVVAFGAAAVVFNTLSRSVGEFANSLVEVDKSLAEINVNLNQSQQGLKQFGGQLFNVARQTGQTFEVAAKSAAELARQGLSADETIKRLKDSLILSRIAGLDSAEAVNTLTAAINSFNAEALTSTEVVNKFAAVDTKFAVSSKDLAEAVSRVGSTAQAAGVGIDQLIALVTSLQQTTARGGATIGNGLKSIFTRVQSAPETVEALQSVGVAIKDTSGNLRSAIDILRDYSHAREKVGEVERQSLDRTVAGTFQINVLKAALADLSKGYSIYDSALQTSVGATDEAIKKNEQLNQTLASLINSTALSLKQLVAAIGDQDLTPVLKGVLGAVENIRKYLSGDTGDSLGKSLGNGILRGLSDVLSGPVVLGIGTVLFGALKKVFTTIRDEARALFDINTTIGARARIQERINILQQNATKEEFAQLQAARSVAEQKEVLIAIQSRLNRELLIGTELQNAFVTPGALGTARVEGGIKPVSPGFADPIASAIQRESNASGLPASQIYVDKDPRVASFANPAGILVANNRDEPLGGFQGVNRVIGQGGNPKTGSVPGFAKTPLQTQAEIIAKRLGIGDPRYDESTAKTIKAAKAVSALDAALARSAATQIRLDAQAKQLADTIALVNKGFEGFSKVINSSTYNSPIGPQIPFGANLFVGGVNKFGQRAQQPNNFQPFADIPQGQFSGDGGYAEEFLRQSATAAARKRASGTPFGPAFPINPALAERLRREADARNGIFPGTDYDSPIGPPTQVDSARQQILRQAVLRKKLQALVGLQKQRAEQAAQAIEDAKREKVAQAEVRNRNRAFGLSFLAPFAAGFVQPGFESAGISTRGGTLGGQGSGAIEGALSGASLGVFGPQAAALGIAVGAVVGYLKKLSPSLEEFNEAIDKNVALAQTSVDAASRILAISGELSQGGLRPDAAARFQQQRAEALQDVDPEFRSRLADSSLSQEAIAKIVGEIGDKAQRVSRQGEVQKGANALGERSFLDRILPNPLNPAGGAINRFFKLFGDQFAGVTQARGIGKSLGGLITPQNVSSIDEPLLNRIIGGRSQGGDFDKLAAIYQKLGSGAEITADKQVEFAEALQSAAKRYQALSKIIADEEVKAQKGGLLPGAFVNPLNSDTFRNAALTSRNPRAGQTLRGQSRFSVFQELISAGATTENILKGNPLYDQSKALSQSTNVADPLIGYLSGFGNLYNVSKLRQPNGNPNLASIQRLLERRSKSGVNDAAFAGYLAQYAAQAQNSLTNAGVKPQVLFTQGVTGITPGADYGAFTKTLKRGGTGYINAGNLGSVFQANLAFDEARRSKLRGIFDFEAENGSGLDFGLNNPLQRNQEFGKKIGYGSILNYSPKPYDNFINAQNFQSRVPVDQTKYDLIQQAQKAAADTSTALANATIQTNVNVNGLVKIVSDAFDDAKVQVVVNAAVQQAMASFISEVRGQVANLNGKPLPPTTPLASAKIPAVPAAFAVAGPDDD